MLNLLYMPLPLSIYMYKGVLYVQFRLADTGDQNTTTSAVAIHTTTHLTHFQSTDMITQSSSQASTSSTEPERSSTPPGLVELDASPYTVQSSFKVYDRHDLESIISPRTNPLICQILYNAMALGRAFLTVDHVRRRICWAFRQSFRTASQDWSDPPAVQPPEQVTRDTLLERRMDEWLQGQNCRVSLFEPINEEESKCDGFNKSVEPKTLYINLDVSSHMTGSGTRSSVRRHC